MLHCEFLQLIHYLPNKQSKENKRYETNNFMHTLCLCVCVSVWWDCVRQWKLFTIKIKLSYYFIWCRMLHAILMCLLMHTYVRCINIFSIRICVPLVICIYPLPCTLYLASNHGFYSSIFLYCRFVRNNSTCSIALYLQLQVGICSTFRVNN